MVTEAVTFRRGRRVYIYGLGSQDVGYIGYTARGQLVLMIPAKNIRLTVVGIKGGEDVTICTNKKCMGEVINGYCLKCGQGTLEGL